MIPWSGWDWQLPDPRLSFTAMSPVLLSLTRWCETDNAHTASGWVKRRGTQQQLPYSDITGSNQWPWHWKWEYASVIWWNALGNMDKKGKRVCVWENIKQEEPGDLITNHRRKIKNNPAGSEFISWKKKQTQKDWHTVYYQISELLEARCRYTIKHWSASQGKVVLVALHEIGTRLPL